MFCWKHHCWDKGYICRRKSLFVRLTQSLIIYDPFVSRGSLSQLRPLRDLCSFVFGTANIIFEIAYSRVRPVRALL